jgi:hypothetical protein
MSKNLIPIANMTVAQRCEVLDRLSLHLEHAADQASREGDEIACAEFEELAFVLVSQKDEIAADKGISATDIVAQAVRMLSKLYLGRDPGWFLVH